MLFHGLAFGNTDTISLENYKSHTTTPTNHDADQSNAKRTTGSKATLQQTNPKSMAMLPVSQLLSKFNNCANE